MTKQNKTNRSALKVYDPKSKPVYTTDDFAVQTDSDGNISHVVKVKKQPTKEQVRLVTHGAVYKDATKVSKAYMELVQKTFKLSKKFHSTYEADAFLIQEGWRSHLVKTPKGMRISIYPKGHSRVVALMRSRE